MINILKVKWENEDELPEMTNDEYNSIFGLSVVYIVRLFPYVEINGEKYYLSEVE